MGGQQLILSEVLKELNSMWLFGGGGETVLRGAAGTQAMVGGAGRDAEPESSRKTLICYALSLKYACLEGSVNQMQCQ